MKKFFYWLPRVLSVVFACFISIFAFDVLGQPNWFPALLIHLIPVYFLIALAIVSWKREIIGGILYLVAGIMLYVFTNLESLVVSAPAFVIGLLFLSSKFIRTRIL